MANNSIIMSLDIRKNNNALSKCFGHYFAEVHRLGTLSTYALAKHMSEHNNLFGEEDHNASSTVVNISDRIESGTGFHEGDALDYGF